MWATARTSPDSAISPNTAVSGANGTPLAEDASAAATARSAAGSPILSPPATFRYMSLPASARPQRASSTAMIMARRPESQPTTARRGVARAEGAIRDWISTSSGRVPSMPAKTQAPLTSP